MATRLEVEHLCAEFVRRLALAGRFYRQFPRHLLRLLDGFLPRPSVQFSAWSGALGIALTDARRDHRAPGGAVPKQVGSSQRMERDVVAVRPLASPESTRGR